MINDYQKFLCTDFKSFGHYLEHHYVRDGKMSYRQAGRLVTEQRDIIQKKIEDLQWQLERM